MTPILSILVPFYRDDPSGLVRALAGQYADLESGAAELILYDDGSADSELTGRVETALEAWPGPAGLILGGVNKGRAAARNALAEAATAPHLLFLDADMLPSDSYFVCRWLNAARGRPDIVFGGFQVPDRVAPESALHRAFSASGDCLDARARNRNPAQYVCTSNLLVRADVLRAAPFDAGFSGWGWEDSEWAARAAAQFRIDHIDNPAIHLGLESADTLLTRFRDSAVNYARFVSRHPDLAATLGSYAWARRVKRAPAVRRIRPVLAALARGHAPAPMPVRVLALKLWRASWYSEVLP
mgnify:CR=1 FL=1